MRIVALLWAYHLGARAIIQKQEDDLVPLQAVEDALAESTTGAPVFAEEAQTQNLHNTSADQDEIYEIRPDIIVRNLIGGGTLRKKAGGTAQFGKHGAAHLVRKIEGESEEQYQSRRKYFSSMAESAEHSTTLEVRGADGDDQGIVVTTHSECAADDECETRWSVCFLSGAVPAEVEECYNEMADVDPDQIPYQLETEVVKSLDHGSCLEIHARTHAIATLALGSCARAWVRDVEEQAPMIIDRLMPKMRDLAEIDVHRLLMTGEYNHLPTLDLGATGYTESRSIPALGGSRVVIDLIDAGCNCRADEFVDSDGRQTRVVMEAAVRFNRDGTGTQFAFDIQKCATGWTPDTCGTQACGEGMGGRGTSLAATMVSRSAGVAPGAMVKCYKAVDDSGYGSIAVTAAFLRDQCGTTTGQIDGVKQDNHHVIVISLQLKGYSPRIAFLINECLEVNRPVIVGAGPASSGSQAGTNPSCQYSPANTPAFTVGPVSFQKISGRISVAPFSNYGDCVNIWAPAVNILTRTERRQFRKLSGTSLGVANVAGIAALTWTKHFELSAMELLEQLMCSAAFGYLDTIKANVPLAAFKADGVSCDWPAGRPRFDNDKGVMPPLRQSTAAERLQEGGRDAAQKMWERAVNVEKHLEDLFNIKLA